MVRYYDTEKPLNEIQREGNVYEVQRNNQRISISVMGLTRTEAFDNLMKELERQALILKRKKDFKGYKFGLCECLTKERRDERYDAKGLLICFD